MVKFNLEISTSVVSVNRQPVYWMCQLQIPDHLSERLPAHEALKLQGCFCLSFYADPLPGDRVFYEGHTWRVDQERTHTATRYKTRNQQRQISQLTLTLIEYNNPDSSTVDSED